ncbi:MAG: hypothetical protein IJ581_00040 [Paludibacteraceae bacterium]|nr:hypothetical protein [Paludibacteraceae bacterium]
MKKIFSLLVVVLITLGVSARGYQYSLGLVGGSGIGVQMKAMVLPNVTIMDELGYFGCYNGINGSYFGLVDQLVIGWQDIFAEEENMEFSYYVGPQIKGGYLGNDVAGNAVGMVGAGAAAGVEANMMNAPIAVSFDFRPGYAMTMGKNPAAPLPGQSDMLFQHLFDWSINLAVRYTF